MLHGEEMEGGVRWEICSGCPDVQDLGVGSVAELSGSDGLGANLPLGAGPNEGEETFSSADRFVDPVLQLMGGVEGTLGLDGERVTGARGGDEDSIAGDFVILRDCGTGWDGYEPNECDSGLLPSCDSVEGIMLVTRRFSS
jgi:hypothetical protein